MNEYPFILFFSTHPYISSLLLVVEGGGKEGRLKLPSIANPRVRGLQRDAEGLEGQPLTRSHCHGGVLAAFSRELLKNGSRAISVGTEAVYRERAELETAFPRCIIIHPEQLIYVRLSVEKGGCLAALSESGRMSGRTRGDKTYHYVHTCSFR
jgi:hypothetical protein